MYHIGFLYTKEYPMNETSMIKGLSLFNYSKDILPERFKVIGALNVHGDDYVVIGREGDDDEDTMNYCSWLYNPNCGFIYGHYRLTREEALNDLIKRG